LGISNEHLENAIRSKRSIKNIDGIPDRNKKLFETSLEISWDYHLLHQKAFQKHTDNAVSKTISLPENASVEYISEIYFKAWEYKLKGITIYRHGSKSRQVLQKCNLNSGRDC
jgi:ribonucleoside-diphosphate reductase alpha chain